MKINTFWKQAPDSQHAKADVVLTPFRRGERAAIPVFMKAVIAGKPANKASEQRGHQKDNGEKQFNRPALSETQRRRAARFYEAYSRMDALIQLTKATEIYVQHGSLIGTFLLQQFNKLGVNVRYHEFDEAEWPVLKDHVVTKSAVTIHVFHSAATPDLIEDKFVPEVKCFVPNQHFVIPAYIEEVILDENDQPKDWMRKRQILALYHFINMIKVCEEIGGELVVVQHADLFGDDLTKIFSKIFPKQKRFNFPEAKEVQEAVVASKIEAPETKEKKEPTKAPSNRLPAAVTDGIGNQKDAAASQKKDQTKTPKSTEHKRKSTAPASAEKLQELTSAFSKA
jgi:hypothetical protein